MFVVWNFSLSMLAIQGGTRLDLAFVLGRSTILLGVILIVCIDLLLQAKSREVVIKHCLLLSLDLSKQLRLVNYGLLSLLVSTLNAAVHPVLVVACWL